MLGVFTNELRKLITANFLPMFDRFIEQGNIKAYDRSILWVSALVQSFQAILVFLVRSVRHTQSIDVMLAAISPPRLSTELRLPAGCSCVRLRYSYDYASGEERRVSVLSARFRARDFL